MKHITRLPQTLLSCIVASMALFIVGAADTVRAEQKLMTDILNTAPAPMQAPAAATTTNTITGKVTQVLSASGITYAEIDTGSGKVWAAGPAPVPPEKGDRVTIETGIGMQNYHSKYLDRNFDIIYFVKGFNADKAPATTAIQNTVPQIQPQKPVTSTASTKPAEVAVGGYLTEASLDGLNVETKSLSSFRGKPLIINMWASYCGPCKAEMGSLERLAQKYNGKEFNIIGITIDDYRDKAEAFIEETGITFANFQDHNLHMETMLGTSFIPLTVLVDAQGRLLQKIDGARPWDDPRIIAAIEKVFQLKLEK